MTGGGAGGSPALFYKYRDAEKAREILATRVVWRCSPLRFNDPFDTHYFWRLGFELNEASAALAARIERFIRCDDPLPSRMPDTLQEQVRYGRLVRQQGRLAAALPHLKAALAEGAARVTAQLAAFQREWREKSLRTMRIFCLSEVHDDLLMWAHYADCHRGAVIGFRDVPGKNSALCGDMRAVSYQAELPALVKTVDEWVANITGEAPIDMHAALFKMVLTKSDHWAYEKEWRWWDRADPEDDRLDEPIRVDAEDFAVVYLGCRMTADDQHAIVQIVRESLPHVQLYQARQSGTRFALDFVPLTVR